jgi:hypothetical protein
MSANSNETGSCKFCGHFMSAHTKAASSKCKKCGKRIIICQATIHNETRGWKICDVPCGCGHKYFPAYARGATPLEPDNFASTHPLYVQPSFSDDDDETYPPEGSDHGELHATVSEDFTSTYLKVAGSNQEAPGSFDRSPETFPADADGGTGEDELQTESYVDLFTGKDGNLYFAETGEPTSRELWEESTRIYGGVEQPCYYHRDDTGFVFWTWSLGSGKPSKDKSVATLRWKKNPHRRESTDQLQWDADQLEAEEALVHQMARLGVVDHGQGSYGEGPSSHGQERTPAEGSNSQYQTPYSKDYYQGSSGQGYAPGESPKGLPPVTAWYGEKGRVWFYSPDNGQPVKSRGESWIKQGNGSFRFESVDLQRVFWAKKIHSKQPGRK